MLGHRRAAALLVIALSAPAACADPSAEPSATPQTPTSSAPTTTDVPASSAPTTTDVPASSVPTTTDATPAPGSETELTSALLPTRTLPPLNAQTPWRRASRSRAPLSVCQKVSLPNIGATRLARRDYRAGDAGASHVVATFPDELTAGYGFDILEAWLRTCATRVVATGYERSDVPSAYTPLDVGDRSGWVVFFYGPAPGQPEAAYIQAEALVLDGKHLSWLVERSIGQDYDYEVGDTPPERAAPLMAVHLSALAASA